MRQKLTMQALWESYRISVIPRDAPEVQITECRRAFYGGAKGLMDAVMLALDPTREPTDADVAYMGGLQHELDQFCEGVMAGRA